MAEATRILIVEDEVLVLDAIALALSQEGYEVVTMIDGRAALELIYPTQGSRSPQQFDLIILDILLPGLNGLDFCQYLRSRDNEVPILIVSARGSETDRVVGLEMGADDYLAKPFGMRELIARCRALLRRQGFAAQASEALLTWGEITLNPTTYQATLRGRILALTPKEYRLLEVFMRSPRRVWNREDLIERVWGEDFMGDIKTVDVHIRWLREKLEDDPSRPRYIVTVRGFGYRFG